MTGAHAASGLSPTYGPSYYRLPIPARASKCVAKPHSIAKASNTRPQTCLISLPLGLFYWVATLSERSKASIFNIFWTDLRSTESDWHCYRPLYNQHASGDLGR